MTYCIGEIVLVRSLPIYEQKSKYAVFIAIAPNNFLLINSENREDYDCVPLLKKNRVFPKYDSFIACKQIFTADDSQIASRHGLIDIEELTAICTKIAASKTLSKIDKKRILDSLAGEIDRRSVGK